MHDLKHQIIVTKKKKTNLFMKIKDTFGMIETKHFLGKKIWKRLRSSLI